MNNRCLSSLFTVAIFLHVDLEKKCNSMYKRLMSSSVRGRLRLERRKGKKEIAQMNKRRTRLDNRRGEFIVGRSGRRQCWARVARSQWFGTIQTVVRQGLKYLNAVALRTLQRTSILIVQSEGIGTVLQTEINVQPRSGRGSYPEKELEDRHIALRGSEVNERSVEIVGGNLAVSEKKNDGG